MCRLLGVDWQIHTVFSLDLSIQREQGSYPKTFGQVLNWVCEVLGEVKVSAEPPQNSPETKFVSLYLKDIETSPSTGVKPVGDRLQLILSYLVTVNSKDLDSINSDIVKLAFSAMTSENIEPVFTPLSASEWNSFGVTPRPSFIIKIPLNYDIKDIPIAKLVEKPLVIKEGFLLDNENT